MAVIVYSTEYWLDYGTGGMASNNNDMFYVVNNIEGHKMLQGTERTGRLG